MRRLQQQTLLRWDPCKNRIPRQISRPESPRRAFKSRSLVQGTLTDPVVLGEHLVFDSNSSSFLYPSNTEGIVTVSHEETDYGIFCFLRTDENESYSHVEGSVHFSVGDSSILLNNPEYSRSRRQSIDICSESCLSDNSLEFCKRSACYVSEPVNRECSCRL